MEKPKIYSVGHSSRRLGELVSILKRYNVRVLVDVRSYPTSKRNPWFNKKTLSERLEAEGIKYMWLGDLLGGLHEPYYPERLETLDYRIGVGVLVSLAVSLPGKVAFMCREKYWMNCHRAYIAETLHSLGIKVVHIIDLGVAEQHKPLGVKPSWLKPLDI